MWDDNSIYLNIETGEAFTVDLSHELVEKLNSGKFNQGSAVLKVKYHNPPELIFQHLPVKERVIKN